MSTFKPRRPYYDDQPDGYQESDDDFIDNNFELALQLLAWEEATAHLGGCRAVHNKLRQRLLDLQTVKSPMVNKTQHEKYILAGNATYLDTLFAERDLAIRQREDLRRQFVDLQHEIALLIPAHDGDRANDPVTNRVQRVMETLRWIVGYDEDLNRREVAPTGDDYNRVVLPILWLLGIKP